MNARARARFDELLEGVLEQVPRGLLDLLEQAPLVVEDRPSPELLRDLGLPPDDSTLCGLYTGTSIVERSVEDVPGLPEHIQIFRDGIVEHAGGWEPWQDDEGSSWGGAERIREEIRITLLHEIGHHFGLEEEDLEDLGYA